MRFNKRLSIFMVILLIMLSFVGCKSKINIVGSDSQEEREEVKVEEKPISGGKVILPLTNFNTLNPLRTDNSYYYQFSKLIYEPLFEFTDDLSVEAKLVENYSVENNGQLVKLRLKENVKWHDDTNFTSNDVAFTIDTIKALGPEGTYGPIISKALGFTYPNNINTAISYQVIDSHSINIIFNEVYANALEVLTFPIIPAHISGQNEIENFTTIGTGPFKFESYEKYKNLKLKANDSYWNGRPYIDEVIGKVLDNEEVILMAFETGQLNMASTTGTDWDKYKQNSRIKVLEYISPAYEYMGFNFNNSLINSEMGKSIRQAINYGIDRQGIIEKVYLGHGNQVDVPIHPNSYLLSEKANSYGYNPERAREILEGLGYRDINGDGILQDEGGNRLSFRITTNSFNPYRLKTAELISEDLLRIGINPVIDYVTEGIDGIDDETKDIQWENFNRKIQTGDFDIAVLGWDTSPIIDHNYMFNSGMISSGSNFIRYNNETMDNLLGEIYRTNDKEQRIDKYGRFQDHIIEELPYISLFYRNRGLLLDKSIRGEINPNFFYIYRGLEKSFILN